MATYTTKSCPYCNHKYTFMAPRGKYYGSPFLTCAKCHQVFVDKDYVEIGLNYPEEYKPLRVNPISIIFLIGGSLFTWACISVGGFGLVSYIGAAFGFFFVISDILDYKNRVSEYNDELCKSNERLSDPEYIFALKKIGCDVPQWRIDSAMQQIRNRPGNAEADL